MMVKMINRRIMRLACLKSSLKNSLLLQPTKLHPNSSLLVGQRTNRERPHRKETTSLLPSRTCHVGVFYCCYLLSLIAHVFGFPFCFIFILTQSLFIYLLKMF